MKKKQRFFKTPMETVENRKEKERKENELINKQKYWK